MKLVQGIGTDTNKIQIKIISQTLISPLDFKEIKNVWLKTASSEYAKLENNNIVPYNGEIPDFIANAFEASEQKGLKYPIATYVEEKS